MADSFGAGAQSWGNGHDGRRGSGELKNRGGGGGGYSSYQNSAGDGGGGSSSGGYVPPSAGGGGGSYAERQTRHVEEAVRSHYEAEGTAAGVMSLMASQRGQLQGAKDIAGGTRERTEQAQRELDELSYKTRRKRRRLQYIAAGLAVTDALLFLRICQCGGNFFCAWK